MTTNLCTKIGDFESGPTRLLCVASLVGPESTSQFFMLIFMNICLAANRGDNSVSFAIRRRLFLVSLVSLAIWQHCHCYDKKPEVVRKKYLYRARAQAAQGAPQEMEGK